MAKTSVLDRVKPSETKRTLDFTLQDLDRLIYISARLEDLTEILDSDGHRNPVATFLIPIQEDLAQLRDDIQTRWEATHPLTA